MARRFRSCHNSKPSAGFSGRVLGFSDPSRSRFAGDAGRGVILICGDVFPLSCAMTWEKGFSPVGGGVSVFAGGVEVVLSVVEGVALWLPPSLARRFARIYHMISTASKFYSR